MLTTYYCTAELTVIVVILEALKLATNNPETAIWYIPAISLIVINFG